MPTTLINVSNRLPVTVGDDKITKSSGGLVAALEGLSAEKYEIQWIGWPGGVTDLERQEGVERRMVAEYGCIPVFLSAEEEEAFYEGFSNSSIWPLLHYMPDYLRYEPDWWEEYRKVNQRFADKVLGIAKKGDMVWVHDYQLLLLPAMLRKASSGLRIGFFLHTPFPRLRGLPLPSAPPRADRRDARGRPAGVPYVRLPAAFPQCDGAFAGG